MSLARQFLELTRPRGKRPPVHGLENANRVTDLFLGYLYENGSMAAPGALSEAFGVSPARVAKLLGDLEDRGLIRRESVPGDRRRVSVRLTAMGEHTVLARREAMERRTAALLEGMGERDAEELVRLTGRLVALIAAAGCCQEQGCGKEGEHEKDLETAATP